MTSVRCARLACAAGALLFLASCGEEHPTPGPSLVAFRARMERLVDRCVNGSTAEAEADAKDLLLPDAKAWFARTFDESRVEGLYREYAIWEARVPELPAEVRKNREAGKRALLTERFAEPGDELATGYQSNALRLMRERTPLYSLRLVEPGEQEGWHLWSFAWVDGAFRFVGRLMAASPETATPGVARLGVLRIKTAAEIRKQR